MLVNFIQNIPQNTVVRHILDKFKSHNPISFQKLGSPVVQSVFSTAADALKASSALSSAKINDAELHTYTVKLPDGKYAVQVTDFPESCDLNKARDFVNSTLSPLFSQPSISVLVGSPKKIILRVTPTVSSRPLDDIMEEIKSSVKSISGSFQVSAYDMKKPAIFVRGVAHTKSGAVTKVMTEFGATRVQELGYRSEQVPSDLAVAYFNTEESALFALKKTKAIALDGRKIHVTYKETSEPAFQISNLPLDASAEEVYQVLRQNFISPVNVQIFKVDSTSSAVVSLGYPKEVEIACNAFRKTVSLRGNTLSATPKSLNDIAIEVSVPTGSDQDLLQLQDSIINSVQKCKDISSLSEKKVISNVSALISFASLKEANTAQADFTSGAISPFESAVASKLVAFPSYTIEVDGFPPTEPASKLVDAVEADKYAKLIGCSRSAILKFRRHRDIQPGFASLSKCQIDGKYIKAVRYNPLNIENEGEYDRSGYDEEWDRFNLRGVLQDFMYTDPAIRFQVARNHFENAVRTAKIDGLLEYLIDENSSADLKAEVQRELANATPNLDRLFEIFIQKKDMQKFSHDFLEMRSLLGKEDASDPFDWSEFRMEDAEDVKRLQEAMHQHDQKASSGIGASIKGGSVESSIKKAAQLIQENEAHDATDSEMQKIVDQVEVLDPLGKFEDNDAIIDPTTLLSDMNVTVENDETGEKEQINLENPDKMIDKDGHVWAGAILDADMVQKTMPGNRIATHRVLVIVGNLRGAAGFGVGKGKMPQDAVNAAFRDALRNLLYVDLYDNFGLAHDVKGKHNSCHAYIRATPSSRVMVASPFAAAVLNRFGIYSASCKLIGRRNPYSMVRAIFNALAKHENLDETAKARGQRYLTLRWAYDKNV